MSNEKDLVRRVAKEAATDWFVDTGKIQHRREFNENKKIRDYGITRPELSNLSKAVVVKVKLSTGKTLELPHDWHDRIADCSVADFLGALPGQSGTDPSHPGGLPGRPRRAATPGKSTIPASHSGSLPGKPKAT